MHGDKATVNDATVSAQKHQSGGSKWAEHRTAIILILKLNPNTNLNPNLKLPY